MILVSDFLLSKGYGEFRMVMAHNTKSRCSRHLGGQNKTYVQGLAPPSNIKCAPCHKEKVALNSHCSLDHSGSKNIYVYFALRCLNRHF